MDDAKIDGLMEGLARSYRGMIDRFRPCKPGSEFLEQNLITLFSHQFLLQNPAGIAYTEIPFSQELGGHWSSRLDGYFATDESAVFLEAKGSLSKENLFGAMANDLKRIKSVGLATSMKLMASGQGRKYSIPEKQSALLLADTWSKETRSEWEIGTNLATELQQLVRKSYVIGNYGAYEYSIITGWEEF